MALEFWVEFAEKAHAEYQKEHPPVPNKVTIDLEALATDLQIKSFDDAFGKAFVDELAKSVGEFGVSLLDFSKKKHSSVWPLITHTAPLPDPVKYSEPSIGEMAPSKYREIIRTETIGTPGYRYFCQTCGKEMHESMIMYHSCF